MNKTITSTSKIDYQKLFESLPARYIAFLPDDPDFTIVAESDAHADVAMVQQKDVVGRPLFEVFPDMSDKYKETGVSDLAESFRTVMKTGKPDAMPPLRYDLKRPDGSIEERYWKLTHYPVFDKEGKLQLIYQNTVDITKEFTVEQKLELAEQQLEEALSTGMIGTWIWDLQSNKVIANKNMASIFNVSESEAAKGLPISAFTAAMHPGDKVDVQAAIEKAIATKGKFEYEYRTLDRDGSTRWVLARGRVELDDKGAAKTFPGVLVDITERKVAENNLSYLAKASTTLSSSLDYTKTLQTTAQLLVPDIADWCSIEILDENGQLKQVAVAHKDPAKVKWAKDYRKKQGPPPLDSPTGIPKVIRTGESELYPDIPDELLVAAAKNEEELKLARELGFSSVIIVPLKVNNKTVGGITIVSAELKRHYTQTDLEMAEELASRASLAMTNASLYDDAQRELKERQRLQEQLRAANQELESRVQERTSELEKTNTELERSNRELEDFAYVASHDLQEPLRKIQAFSNLVESEYGERLGEGRDYVTRMRNAASRMSVLIQDLLEFSRVTTKGRDFVQVDLEKVAYEVTNDLQARIEDTGGVVEIAKLPTIDADPTQMRQLLQNLIGNALKFHTETTKPIVKVSATVENSKSGKPESCILAVADNGVGFDEKYLDRIFAVFQRLHGRDSYEGTGIGLAVCRKIVERHAGTITATSSPGKGAKFIITLPMQHKKETS